MKVNKNILWFAIIYNILNGLIFLYATNLSGGDADQMLIVFPIFYLIGIIGLTVIGIKNKKCFRHWINWLLAILSTPIPSILIVNLLIIPLQSRSRPDLNFYFNQGSYQYKQYIWYGKNGRIEYWKNTDKIKNGEYFPKGDVWVKDSIWTYYKSDGTIDRVEKYKDGKLIKEKD